MDIELPRVTPDVGLAPPSSVSLQTKQYSIFSPTDEGTDPSVSFVDGEARLNSLLTEARILSLKTKAERLLHMVSALTQQLVESPQEWSDSKRVSVWDQDRNEVSLLHQTIKSESYLVRRYVISKIRDCVKLQHVRVETERIADTTQWKSKKLIGTASRLRAIFREIRESILVAERLFVALVFLELTVAALDHLAYGDVFCSNASAKFALDHDNAMYVESLRYTFLTTDQKEQLKNIEAEILRADQQNDNEKIKTLTEEHDQFTKLLVPENTRIDANTPLDEIPYAAKLEKKFNMLHLRWADKHFSGLASKDYWIFNRSLHKRLGDERAGLADTMEEMLIKPRPYAKRQLLKIFWKTTILKDYENNSIWYEDEPLGVDSLIESHQHTTGMRIVSMLRESGEAARLWQPDLTEETKPNFM